MPSSDETSPPPPTLAKRKLARLVVLAVLEIAAAWLLVHCVIAYGDSLYAEGAAGTAESTTAQIHAHGGRVSQSGAQDDPSSTAGWIFLSIALIAGVTLWLVRRRVEWVVSLSGGLAIAVAMLLPAVARTAEMSHVAMMVRLMILIVVAPALFADAARREFTPPITAVRWIAIPGAVAYGIAMITWHLPHTSSGSFLVGPAATFALGVVLWAGVLLDTRADLQRLRTVAIYVAGAPAGVIGLALVFSAQPIGMAHDASAGSWLGPLADQRLGGVLMMAIEAVFIIPLLMNAARIRSNAQADN